MSRSRLLVFAFALFPAVLLAPFLSKPFNVDDTLFVAVARQIQRDPARPFDGRINWYQTTEQVWDVTKNPPLVPYLLALAFALCGESERVGHVALLPFAMALGALTYHLARRFTRRPAFAAALFLLSPAFLGCALSVMSDVPAAALLLGAVALFLRACDSGSQRAAAGAGLLLGLAALAKYQALLGLPVIAAAHILRRGRWSSFAAAVSSALVLFAVWGAWGFATHGSAHFLDSLFYGSALKRIPAYAAPDAGAAVIFTLSSLVSPLLFAVALLPRARPRRLLLLPPLVGAAAACALALICRGRTDLAAVTPLTAAAAFVVFALATILCAAVVAPVREDLASLRAGGNGEPGAWRRPLLFLWAAITILYVGFVALPVNVRFLLPGLPAVLFLAIDAFDRALPAPRAGAALSAAALLVTGALGLGVAAAEGRWADLYRDAPRKVIALVPAGHRLLADGHWGFQYYLEKEGVRLLEMGADTLHAGDLLVRSDEADPRLPIEEITPYLRQLLELEPRPGPPIVTMCRAAGAGFHHDAWGIFPFALSHRPADVVRLFIVRAPPGGPPG